MGVGAMKYTRNVFDVFCVFVFFDVFDVFGVIDVFGVFDVSGVFYHRCCAAIVGSRNPEILCNPSLYAMAVSLLSSSVWLVVCGVV